jgi:hypothetical protein
MTRKTIGNMSLASALALSMALSAAPAMAQTLGGSGGNLNCPDGETLYPVTSDSCCQTTTYQCLSSPPRRCDPAAICGNNGGGGSSGEPSDMYCVVSPTPSGNVGILVDIAAVGGKPTSIAKYQVNATAECLSSSDPTFASSGTYSVTTDSATAEQVPNGGTGTANPMPEVNTAAQNMTYYAGSQTAWPDCHAKCLALGVGLSGSSNPQPGYQMGPN